MLDIGYWILPAGTCRKKITIFIPVTGWRI